MSVSKPQHFVINISENECSTFTDMVCQIVILAHTHTWFLLEMVNPDVASHTASIKRVLEGLLENSDTDLWNSAYEYYDYVGHGEFRPTLSSWLDKLDVLP